MPICAIINERIFCVHGGLSPHLTDLNQIRSLERPTDVSDTGLLCDLLWSDPATGSGWAESHRGFSMTFGEDVVEKFLRDFGLEFICRSHEYAEEGYHLFANGTLATVFSIQDYRDLENDGAVMVVSDRGERSFSLLSKK